MKVLLLLFCALTTCTYGQVSNEEIVGKWFLIKFEIDSIPIVDKRNPMNVVSQNMYQLKKVNPNYTATDSIEYANQILTRMSSFDKYSIEFFENGVYRNTKITRGLVTEEKEEGKFEIEQLSQTLIQIDSKQKTSESRIELNNGLLKLLVKVGDKEAIMTFEKR